jgi:hypothetical protein
MNIIAIILLVISLIMLVAGIAMLVTNPKSITIPALPPNSSCPSGGAFVQLSVGNNTLNVKCTPGKDYTGKTKVYYTGKLEDITADTVSLDRHMNIPGIILTILGLMGLIGSLAMMMMHHSPPPPHSPTVNVNPVLYNPDMSYPSSGYMSPVSPTYSSGFPSAYP